MVERVNITADKKLIKKYDDLLKDYKSLIVDCFDEKDFYAYTKDLFTAHSCAIEGNSFTVNETRELREKGLKLKLQNKSLFEAFEIIDHFNAYDYAFKNLDKPLTEEFIKKIHFYLTEHTHEYAVERKPGEYTDTDMGAGTTIFGDHKELIASVPKLLASFQKGLETKYDPNSTQRLHPVPFSARFHYYFIYLHPFKDGNGRLGRILSNVILAKEKQPLIIIPAEKKQDYINSLTTSKKYDNPAFIENFFLQTAIERMDNEISQKKNPSMNFLLKPNMETKSRGFKR